MKNEIVSIKNVKLKLSDNFVLNNINLNLYEGNRCILIGINGSGKSVLLRTIAGKHLINSGDMKINNVNMTNFHNNPKGIAHLADTWTRSVAFNGYSVAYSADIKVKDMMQNMQNKYPIRRKILLDVLSINPNWRMHLVSTGQRRRVRLFLGLLEPFKIALIDEMTMDLDIIIRKKFMRWLKEESETNNSCIIYTTHIFDGLKDWPTHIAHIKPSGILLKSDTKDYENNENNVEDLAFNALYSDYEILEKSVENEDGKVLHDIKITDENQVGFNKPIICPFLSIWG